MYTLHMQENICGQVKLRIYDVQDTQRLSPQHSFKRKVSNQLLSLSSIASNIFVLHVFMFPLISQKIPRK